MTDPAEQLAEAAREVVSPRQISPGVYDVTVLSQIREELRTALAAFDAAADVRKPEREYLNASLRWKEHMDSFCTDPDRMAWQIEMHGLERLKNHALQALLDAHEAGGAVAPQDDCPTEGKSA